MGWTLIVPALGLAQSWQVGPGFRCRPLAVPAAGHTGFTLLKPEQTGIWFTNVLPEQRHLTNQVLPSGSGVAAGDVDGDGLCDLFFCGLGGGSRLYRNLGNWRFEDITAQAGVACPDLDVTGAVLADLDGDGALDLVINSIGGGTHIFRNNGRGHFTRDSQVLNSNRAGFSLALADARGKGVLDLYIANYRPSLLADSPGTRFNIQMVNGQPMVASINGRPLTDPEWTNRFRFRFELGEQGRGRFGYEELGEADLFCRGDGRGHLTPVSWTDGTFLDEAGRALAEPPFDWGLSVMFRDFNGDGLPDLYICNDFMSPDRFWLNDGQGHFRAAPLVSLRHTSFSAMAIDVADINRDGLDDFIVVDMLSREHRRRLVQRNAMHAEMTRAAQLVDRPQYPRNMLFLNRGDGTYAEIAQYAGLDASEWSWTPIFLDVDLDGYEDLLVSSGFERDNMNTDVQNRIRQARVAGKLPSREELALRRMFPRLTTGNLAFRNKGNLRFQEVTRQWGFSEGTIAQGTCLGDLDNDGDLDLIVNNLNGAASVFRNESSAPRVAVRLKGLPPNTHGLGARISVTGGPVPQSQEMICGGRYLSCDQYLRVFAAGSLTNRLRIEVTWRSGRHSVVANAQPNYVYEIDEAGSAASKEARVMGKGQVASNSKPAGNSVGPSPLTPALSPGEMENPRPLPGQSEPPSITPARPRALPLPAGEGRGEGERVPQSLAGSGTSTNAEAADFKDGDELSPPQSQIANRKSEIFEDVSSLLGHVHHEEPFDDFWRQPLLPKRLSQLGPGVSWWDVDGDGWEDLVIGSGKGGQLACYRNDGQGGFSKVVGRPWDEVVGRDQTTVVGLGVGTLLVGSANYEEGQAGGAAVEIYRVGQGRVAEGVGDWGSSVGPLAVTDYDGDGQLDLFVGGRVIGGRYPEEAESRLYRQRGGRWELDEANSQRLAGVGMVSGAVWSDLDGDGWPELILACEWGPIRVFHNEHGALREVTAELGLAGYVGWWNGVTTGDLDGDGRLDIIASNWGQNTKYERYRKQPLRIYYGDLGLGGTAQILEAAFEPSLNQYAPIRMLDTVVKAMPFLADKFPTHQAWADAGITAALGDESERFHFREANWLESTVFLNRSGRFEPRVLPPEAQFTPAFAVCVGDYDGDGCEDVFLSQNFFGVDDETSRYDAGRGLWLQGDGRGGVRPVPGQESGVKVYGEQRGAALCDYDHDGRVDLVVAQNGAATKLFHNRQGRPGLRVKLHGPPGNPQGIGAVIRLKFGDRFGPVREVHGGSGYWSQDSAVQVLGRPAEPTQVWVRWPGGKVATADLASGTREVVMDAARLLK